MSNTTEIEKTNLEAHTELCAERYENLNRQLATIDDRIDRMETTVSEIKSLVAAQSNSRMNQLMNWGVAVIASLLSLAGFLVWHIITGGKE